jgi:hypothetical protein
MHFNDINVLSQGYARERGRSFDAGTQRIWPAAEHGDMAIYVIRDALTDCPL